MKLRVQYFSLVVLGLLVAGCATPKVQPVPAVPAERAMRSHLLSFIRDGMTTREEVLLKLGTPSAQFESGRILTYQIRFDKNGALHLVWPRRSARNPALTNWEPEILSLVLVFGPNGLLEKHSLVGAE